MKDSWSTVFVVMVGTITVTLLGLKSAGFHSPYKESVMILPFEQEIDEFCKKHSMRFSRSENFDIKDPCWDIVAAKTFKNLSKHNVRVFMLGYEMALSMNGNKAGNHTN